MILYKAINVVQLCVQTTIVLLVIGTLVDIYNYIQHNKNLNKILSAIYQRRFITIYEQEIKQQTK